MDVTIRDLVLRAGLPPDAALFPFDPAAAGRDSWDNLCGGADAQGGTICLGALLAPGRDAAAETLILLLPEALRADAVFTVTEASLPQLAAWCWQRMNLLLRAALEAQVSSQLANAHLRAHTEMLESSLAMAETAFADFRREPLRLGLHQEAAFVYAEAPAGPPDEPWSLVLHQDIPHFIGNLIYLDLFFGQAGVAGQPGEGRLTVTTAHAGALVCDHSFPLADIVQGWNRFYCLPETTRRKQPLRLSLQLHAPRPAPTRPGLAAPLPDPALCARVEGGGQPARPLALRAWCGIAGLRYPRQTGTLGTAPVRAAGETEILSLPAELVATAAVFQAGRGTPDFSPISYESDTQSLMVHPLGVSPTVARIGRVAVEGLTAVTALAQLRHFDAQPTDFAIAVLPAGQSVRFDADMPQRWLHLQAGEWGDVRCDLAEPVSGLADIYLMTRNRNDDYHLSWAFFRGLQLVCAG